MKSTSLIRKIDDLGRIVIPKDIRTNMHIKLGESLEIYSANDKEIILRKFSIVNNFSLLAKDIVIAINSIVHHSILITDMEKVIATSKCLKKLANKELSKTYINNIELRKDILVNDIRKLCITDIDIKCNYGIVPIISNSNLLGSMMILSEKNPINQSDFNIIKVFSSFLNIYLEE